MRPSLVLFLLAVSPAVLAQQATIEREGKLDPRKNQKIEFIRIEDQGNRIDEVRVGGQTQSITVQPKADVPAYELPSNELSRNRPVDTSRDAAGSRQRTWNVFSF